jgi:putative ABC transport system permease protein
LVWAGVPVLKAAILNFMFFFAILSGSMISLFVALWVARRYTFDEYSRLQPVS